MRLVACPGCQRHVRVNETACPFCSAALEGVAAPLRPLLERSRAAVVFFSTAAMVGCGKDTATPPPTPDAGIIGPPTTTPEVVQPYGVPVIDTTNIPAPPYGVPVMDPTHAPVQPYGVPPIRRDAGRAQNPKTPKDK